MATVNAVLQKVLQQSCRNTVNNFSRLKVSAIYTLEKKYIYTNGALCSQEKDDRDEIVLYKWHRMRYVQFLTRIKFAQALVAVSAMIPLYAGYQGGTANLSTLVLGGCGASAITLLFFGLSLTLQRFIGLLRLDKTSDTVIISTLNFWGRRKDTSYCADSIIPYEDVNSSSSSWFQKLQFINEDKVYIYSLKYGHIPDVQLLMLILRSSSSTS